MRHVFAERPRRLEAADAAAQLVAEVQRDEAGARLRQRPGQRLAGGQRAAVLEAVAHRVARQLEQGRGIQVGRAHGPA